MINLTTNQFNSDGYWRNPIAKVLFIPMVEDVALFDQNGFDLTNIEIKYAQANQTMAEQHRNSSHYALKRPWFTQESRTEGAVLNHSLLFERKGYADEARQQLEIWADRLPLLHKILSIRPKWGLDFSMDYADRAGNAFEILHWEWDSFDYHEIEAVKQTIEPILQNIDWTDAANALIKYKHEWHHLDFFEQSDWKCNYFGIPKERFKMVIWK